MKSERQAFYPSEESLAAMEVCENEIVPEDPELAAWHNSYIESHKLRVALDLDIVKEHVPRGVHVLEFGSVPLLFTAALARSDYKVTGCDIAPERYASTLEKVGIEAVKCDIETEKLPLPSDAFDAIVFNELFEHLRINPIFTFSEVFRVLKPKGALMLSSPNLRSFGGICNFLFKNKAYSCSGDTYAEYRKLENLGHMGHVREYTTDEVVEFLGKTGFQVTKIIYRGRYNTNLRQLAIRAIPSLSPFVSYIATKPG
jgi:SAM-dependent methyltransferase